MIVEILIRKKTSDVTNNINDGSETADHSFYFFRLCLYLFCIHIIILTLYYIALNCLNQVTIGP